MAAAVQALYVASGSESNFGIWTPARPKSRCRLEARLHQHPVFGSNKQLPEPHSNASFSQENFLLPHVNSPHHAALDANATLAESPASPASSSFSFAPRRQRPATTTANRAGSVPAVGSHAMFADRLPGSSSARIAAARANTPIGNRNRTAAIATTARTPTTAATAKPQAQKWPTRLGPWYSFGTAPKEKQGALARFVEGVWELLSAEHGVEAEGDSQASAFRKRNARESLRLLEKQVKEFEQAAILQSRSLGPDILKARPARYAISVPHTYLRQLAGSIGADGILSQSVGDLREGWQLLSGLALTANCSSLRTAAADGSPLQPSTHLLDEVGRALLCLAEARERASLIFAVPPFDVLGAHLMLFDDYGRRQELRKKEEKEVNSFLAKEHLLASSIAATKIFAKSSKFDPSKPTLGSQGGALQPAHLERRVHWSEYRDAERLARLAQKRSKRADSFTGPAVGPKTVKFAGFPC